jgi:hypothetical protein
VQSEYAWPTLFFVALAILSVAADWRRHRRRDADRAAGRAGWIPWPLVTIIALILVAVSVAWWIGDR